MKTSPRLLSIFLLGACLSLAPMQLFAQREDAGEAILPKVKLDRLVQKSDSIVIARVAEKTTTWVDGNIETTYRLDISQDYLNNKRTQGGSLEITTRGGQSDQIPIGQRITGNASMAKGEEVLLFLETDHEERLKRVNTKRASSGMGPVEINPNSKIHTSPRIIGRAKGKFTVLTLPTGERFVTRLSPVGHVHSDDNLKLMADYKVAEMTAKRSQRGKTEKTTGVIGQAVANNGSKRSYNTNPNALEKEVLKSSSSRVAELLDDPATIPLDSAGSRVSATAKKEKSPKEVLEAEKKSRVAEREETEAKALRLVPYNMDAMANPVPIGVFEAELDRLVQRYH
jgi:hypothetical protein